MKFTAQKRIAADILKCSSKHIVFDVDKLSTIKEALTRADIKDLISSRSIRLAQPNAQSRVRARHIAKQKAKGLRKGLGSRKGTAKARSDTKETWMIKLRLQRDLLKQLRDNNRITASTYRQLYAKSKGNFFRNRRHIKQYVQEQELFLAKK